MASRISIKENIGSSWIETYRWFMRQGNQVLRFFLSFSPFWLFCDLRHLVIAFRAFISVPHKLRVAMLSYRCRRDNLGIMTGVHWGLFWNKGAKGRSTLCLGAGGEHMLSCGEVFPCTRLLCVKLSRAHCSCKSLSHCSIVVLTPVGSNLPVPWLPPSLILPEDLRA